MQYTLDAARFGGPALTKKFAMFHSGLVPMARYRRDMHWFDAVDPQSLRIDLFIGQSILDGNPMDFGDVVGGDKDHPTFDFSRLDELVKMLHDKQVLPYWSWCYMPKPVQIGNDFRCGPSDMAAYARIMEHYAAHYREAGLRLGYQEVYNEPDCFDVFLQGPYEHYLEIYRHCAPALLRGDKDAVVGGPSSAFVFTDEEQRKNLSAFLHMVEEENLPLDFFSYHSYGYAAQEYAHRTDIVRELIGNNPRFKAVELHMNELNVVPSPWDHGSWQADLLASRALLPLTFDALRDLAAYTDLTIVHWAQLLNSGVDALGLINADGSPCPGYAAFDVYARMPVRPLHTGRKNMLASADEGRVSLVCWNGSSETEEVELSLANLPFDQGEISLYHLDDAYFASYDGTLRPTCVLPLSDESLRLTLKKDDVVYVEINRTGYAPARRRALEGDKRILRSRYFFEDRSRNTLSWVDEKRSAVYLGMGDNACGLAACAVEMEAQADASLHLTFPAAAMEGGCLAIRLDYGTEEGYARALSFQTAEAEMPSPFGAQRPAEEVLPLNLAGMHIHLADHAPENWNGRLLVSCLMKDGGEQGWAEIHLQ